jgi:metal-dependent amidase/aminoacylase/carboxypeptidase family protein
MPILNRAHELQKQVAEWRQHLHMHPELLFDVHQTAAFVAGKLREFGCDEVVTGLGRTGVVGVIKGNKRGRARRLVSGRHGRAADPRDDRQGLRVSNRARQDACLRP